MKITLLDYGAGNVRSVRNALAKLGCEVVDVETPDDILAADKLIFPGVGSFGLVMNTLRERGYIEPLQRRIREDKPFLGICVALQALFEGSEESPGVEGLSVLSGQVRRFDQKNLAVPQIGWNGVSIQKSSRLFTGYQGEKLYFVHSYHAPDLKRNAEWVLCHTDYGSRFVSGVEKGNVAALQFHPEKSGKWGLQLLQNFLESGQEPIALSPGGHTAIAKRVIACLDVRANDAGDLVVTKGDQYDVREEGEVRNLGKPVELARRYYEEGADEITFLNITGFRDFPMEDQPMLEVLERTSENVFVPLTIGGGIREFTAANGKAYSSLDVASAYFRAGADKVSIGSDAVDAAMDYTTQKRKTGRTSIEQISRVYGAQAVVISVDPRRVYVHSPEDTPHAVLRTASPGPDGQEYCWYQCTIKGGREGVDLDVVQLVTACEELGAGEILLNCIDRDGTNSGFDLELINQVKERVSIPVIASSGAGTPEHFVEVFVQTRSEAALAAGIFHRHEVGIDQVKEALDRAGITTR
jgi:glutamine amidotransferase/cyclase